MEVQYHGILFENEIISALTGKSKFDYQKLIPNSYTCSFDVVAGVNSNENYSIKTSKHGKIVGCGDIIRFWKHSKQSEFSMVIGEWYQDGNNKKYDLIYEFQFNEKTHEILWGDIPLHELTSFDEYVKSIPRTKSAEIQNRKIWKERREDIYVKYNKGIARIDAKINAQNRRVQCSMRIDDLVSSGINLTKYNNNYKGIVLPYEQFSPTRFKTEVRPILHRY